MKGDRHSITLSSSSTRPATACRGRRRLTESPFVAARSARRPGQSAHTTTDW
jgi:hypothetical protein